MKYQNAPISKVTLAVTFDSPKLLEDSKIWGFLHEKQSSNFRALVAEAPVPFEILDDRIYRREVNTSVSGPSSYKIISDSASLFYDLQFNRIALSWYRNDNMPVGNYPGFACLFDEFSKSIQSLNLPQALKATFELIYIDVVPVGELGENLRDLSKFINYNLPTISIFQDVCHANNVFSNFSFKINESCFGILKIESVTMLSRVQGIQFTLMLFSKDEMVNLDKSFEEMHSIQIDTFESMFTEEIKKRWQL
jgi:uncharacterized protein (TIGR04255 family)